MNFLKQLLSKLGVEFLPEVPKVTGGGGSVSAEITTPEKVVAESLRKQYSRSTILKPNSKENYDFKVEDIVSASIKAENTIRRQQATLRKIEENRVERESKALALKKAKASVKKKTTIKKKKVLRTAAKKK